MATKKHLVDNLVEKLDYLTPEDAKYAVDCVLNYVQDELAQGNRVEVRGFGSLSIRKRCYPKKDGQYNTIYYRMSKNVQDEL